VDALSITETTVSKHWRDIECINGYWRSYNKSYMLQPPKACRWVLAIFSGRAYDPVFLPTTGRVVCHMCLCVWTMNFELNEF